MKKSCVYFLFAIIFAMLINVFHPYLWGPDEPREAEISREVYDSGNYVIAHFCSLPFVEKPPLYYDLVALAYHATGEPDAGAARMVSALFGCLMLLVVFLFGYQWGGARRGMLALALLITMPQFYRAAHWILLDIGVGAFCVAALGIFAMYEFLPQTRGRQYLLYFFYAACAGAFWTKGIIGIFHIAVVIGAYILILRRWQLLGKMLFTIALLVFIIPVMFWVYLLWREGGVYYLHEHFICNTVGRILNTGMTLPGSPLGRTDVGNGSPWYFYLERMPAMFGGAIVFIPFVIYEALNKLDWLPHSWIRKLESLKRLHHDNIAVKVLDILLNGKNSGAVDAPTNERSLNLFLLLWAFLPAILLSVPAIKEVTYILPSYAALALMAAAWLDERLGAADPLSAWHFIAISLVCSLAAVFIAPWNLRAYLVVTITILVMSGVLAIFYLIRFRFEKAVMLVLAIILGGIIIGNTPQVMRKTRLNRKCLIGLASHVWQKVGDSPLYVYRGCETLRGSIPFYGNRTTPVINEDKNLRTILKGSNRCFVIMLERDFKRLNASDAEFAAVIKGGHAEIPDFPHLMDNFVLICNKR